jgi:hypothetical protein
VKEKEKVTVFKTMIRFAAVAVGTVSLSVMAATAAGASAYPGGDNGGSNQQGISNQQGNCPCDGQTTSYTPPAPRPHHGSCAYLPVPQQDQGLFSEARQDQGRFVWKAEGYGRDARCVLVPCPPVTHRPCPPKVVVYTPDPCPPKRVVSAPKPCHTPKPCDTRTLRPVV